MRLLHKMYASLFGYFWLPCPVCGRMFGGHEIANCFTAALVAEDGHAYAVCPDPQCSHDAAILNMAGGHAQFVRSNVEFSGTPAALSPEAPLERRVGGAVPPAPTFGEPND